MTLQCQLCPQECILENYQVGLCRVRINRDDRLYSLVYGKPCTVHVDPIEKKPIFHMLPGSGAFSLATAGCNLTCKFCQNWEISQSGAEETRNSDLPPERVVSLALQKGCRSIAYTYSEPAVFYEYMLDTAKLAHRRGLRNIWVTGGYINPEPLRELAPFVDAANIDLKGFTDEYYRKVCGGRLQPVLDAIELSVKLGILVELTNLIIPTLNDDLDRIGEMCRWIRETLGPDVPLHFSRFHPQYRLQKLPPTPLHTLWRAHETALEAGIRYVYTGNVPYDERSNTFCPTCRRRLISRVGFFVTENLLRAGACPFCETSIAGLWT
jgi:pyruvate formate lyase activating enzyme